MRFSPKWIATAALAAASLALGGCAYDDYGYGGVNVGYGVAGGYGGYDDGYYGYPGAAYGYPAYAGYGSGWYNDFYYPGSGYYVFDRGGRRSRWNDGQRRYWQQRNATQLRRVWRGDVRPGVPGRDDGPGRGYGRGRGDRPGIVTRDPNWQNRPGGRPDFRQDGRRDRPVFRDPGRPAPGIGAGGGRRGNGGGGLVERLQRRVERQR